MIVSHYPGSIYRTKGKSQLTSINILLDPLFQRALCRFLGSLCIDLLANVTGAAGIQGTLQSIAFPPEHIVPVLRVAVPILCCISRGDP